MNTSENLPNLPKGWKLQEYYLVDGKKRSRAIDQDDCCWYAIDGKWKLNVPWFRRSPGLPKKQLDDIAMVETIHGKKEFPVLEDGTIVIFERTIPKTEWDH